MNGLRAAIVAAMLLALPASASAKVSFFHSPSGNIECQLSDHYAGQTSAVERVAGLRGVRAGTDRPVRKPRAR